MIYNTLQNLLGFARLSLSNVLPLEIAGRNMQDIYNFLQVCDRIATAGQPTREQFSTIKDSGYQVVLNLALSTSTNAIPDENQLVEALEMEYISIPVVWENPTLNDLEQFFQAMNANTDKKVFVHCAANMRVSAFMYLYRRLQQGITEAEARKKLRQIWQPNENWQQFIQKAIAHYQ